MQINQFKRSYDMNVLIDHDKSCRPSDYSGGILHAPQQTLDLQCITAGNPQV